MFFSPLEQFDIIFFAPGLTPDETFENTQLHVMDVNMVLYFIIILLFFHFIFSFLTLNVVSSTVFYKFFELVYFFVVEMLVQQAGASAVKYLPLIFTTFYFILFSNLIGMLPFGFTLTAHISITLFLALSFNIGFIILGFYKHGLNFLYLFVPSGTPSVLLPLIVVIEVVSYLIRTLSLSVRLFANMMAGHCLLYVISSFAFGILNTLGIVAILPIAVVYVAIFILEFSIAVLQAYVFSILLCIYLNDSLHPVH